MTTARGILLALAIAALAPALPATAETIAVAVEFDSRDQPGSLPRFDPALGSLYAVDFRAVGTLTATFALTPSPQPGAFEARVVQGLLFDVFPASGPPTQFGWSAGGMYSGTNTWFTLERPFDLDIRLSTVHLTGFRGVGNSPFLVENVVTVAGVPPRVGEVWSRGRIEVTYNYVPEGVPEPASLAMLPLGLAVVARLAWRRRRVA